MPIHFFVSNNKNGSLAHAYTVGISGQDVHRGLKEKHP
jgi:hypothetical protein